MSFPGLIAHFFLALDNIHCLDVSQSFYPNSLTERHLGCFQVLATVEQLHFTLHISIFIE